MYGGRAATRPLDRHYVSISSVLFIPALRVFAAVGAHGLAPSSALVGVRFVALLFSLLLVGGAVFAAAIVYCITPPPYSSTVLAKAHGRVDLLLVLFKATLAVVVTPGQWSWFASGFAIVCPLGIAGLYVYLQPYYSSGMQVQEGALIRRWENLFGQISKPSLVPNISFNFKDSLCHIVSGGAITTLTPPFFFHYDIHTLMLQFCQILM